MSTAVILGVVVGASLALDVVAQILSHLRTRGPTQDLARSIVTHIRRPVQVIIPLIAVEVALTAVRMSGPLRSELLHGVGVLLVGATAFLVIRLTYVLDDILLLRYRIDVADNLHARQVHTQVQVLRRVTVVVVSIVAIAIVLLSFSQVRAAGAGLLASAGLIGVVAGIAAKPTVTNVVAGLQLAISQPIRVDDVVVIEGHWGRIEQIALTYVVVKVWDLRRLVIPIAYFVENPFENWTRSTADILGWAHIEVDFGAPVDEIRQEFHRILSQSPDWDGNVWVLQVTGVGPTTMQLRCLMSSRDSSASWNLQCEVREKLMAYLHQHHPGALPRLRTAAAETEPSTSPGGTIWAPANGDELPPAGRGKKRWAPLDLDAPAPAGIPPPPTGTPPPPAGTPPSPTRTGPPPAGTGHAGSPPTTPGSGPLGTPPPVTTTPDGGAASSATTATGYGEVP